MERTLKENIMNPMQVKYPTESLTLSVVPVESLAELIQAIVRQEVRSKVAEELQEKFLSPKETCKLFYPQISLATLDAWAKEGLLQKHYIGGRTYYKYSEVMCSLKTLKKYGRK